VLAEIIAQRAGRHGQPLREAEGPIRHADTDEITAGSPSAPTRSSDLNPDHPIETGV
jgi:hypothetical protein